MEAVLHARGLFSHFRDIYVACVEVSSTDGKIKCTPSKAQPEHHTYWAAVTSNLADKAITVLEPEK